MSSVALFLPFEHSDEDSFSSAKSIVECFAQCAASSSPLSDVYRLAMDRCGISENDPVYKAGIFIATDIDKGIGAGGRNAYHNGQHLCEVLLCTMAIGRTTTLTDRERALVHLAALIHDFHHDGQPNVNPFRLEKIAAERAKPYFEKADMAKEERQIVSTLVLATEFNEGAAFARHCFTHHFEEVFEPDIMTSQQELMLMKNSPRIALQAIVLIEADILPSIGLTIAHAQLVSSRLEKEWGVELARQDKAKFIENAIENLKAAQFYSPNLISIRDHYLADY